MPPFLRLLNALERERPLAGAPELMMEMARAWFKRIPTMRMLVGVISPDDWRREAVIRRTPSPAKSLNVKTLALSIIFCRQPASGRIFSPVICVGGKSRRVFQHPWRVSGHGIRARQIGVRAAREQLDLSFEMPIRAEGFAVAPRWPR